MRYLSWGTGITLVYSAFAAGTLGMVAFAVAHPVDLVGANYYQESTSYDQRIAAIERTTAPGGPRVIVATGERTLTVTMAAAYGRQAVGTVTLYRPSAAGADRSWPLVLDAEGRASLSLRDLAAGSWRVRIEWTAAGQAYYHEQLVQLP